jgi:hypothetical protein
MNKIRQRVSKFSPSAPKSSALQSSEFSVAEIGEITAI